MAETDTYINEHTYCKGSLTCPENVKIDGSFEGDLRVDATVSIGQSGKVKGDVEAQALVLDGEMNGSVTAQDLRIEADGRFFGELRTASLSIASGGLFRGTSIMGEDARGALAPPSPEGETATAETSEVEAG